MTISDFWHRAFLAALNRLSADEAKAEADLALKMAAGHWAAVKAQEGHVFPKWIPYGEREVESLLRADNARSQRTRPVRQPPA